MMNKTHCVMNKTHCLMNGEQTILLNNLVVYTIGQIGTIMSLIIFFYLLNNIKYSTAVCLVKSPLRFPVHGRGGGWGGLGGS